MEQEVLFIMDTTIIPLIHSKLVIKWIKRT